MTASDINILVVEDEQVSSTYIAKVLSVKNWRVDIAHDAMKALDLVRERGYHAIVLDSQTVGMKGAELCRHIREVQPDVREIFLTGMPNITTVYQAMESGAERVLSKPVAPQELVRAIEEQLANIGPTNRLESP
jgi:DNA-binding response OmpR family regulator